MRRESQYAAEVTILRTTAVVELIAIGAMHFVQIVQRSGKRPCSASPTSG